MTRQGNRLGPDGRQGRRARHPGHWDGSPFERPNHLIPIVDQDALELESLVCAPRSVQFCGKSLLFQVVQMTGEVRLTKKVCGLRDCFYCGTKWALEVLARFHAAWKTVSTIFVAAIPIETKRRVVLERFSKRARRNNADYLAVSREGDEQVWLFSNSPLKGTTEPKSLYEYSVSDAQILLQVAIRLPGVDRLSASDGPWNVISNDDTDDEDTDEQKPRSKSDSNDSDLLEEAGEDRAPRGTISFGVRAPDVVKRVLSEATEDCGGVPQEQGRLRLFPPPGCEPERWIGSLQERLKPHEELSTIEAQRDE